MSAGSWTRSAGSRWRKAAYRASSAPTTADSRRDYRELMFRAADAMKNNISGVILYDETIRQNAKDGTPLVKIIEQMGSIPGIKVDAVKLKGLSTDFEKRLGELEIEIISRLRNEA